jgi:hypothetical protein
LEELNQAQAIFHRSFRILFDSRKLRRGAIFSLSRSMLERRCYGSVPTIADVTNFYKDLADLGGFEEDSMEWETLLQKIDPKPTTLTSTEIILDL